MGTPRRREHREPRTAWERWRASVRALVLWSIAYVVGFVACGWWLGQEFIRHGAGGLTEGPTSLNVLLAAVVYWPLAIASWQFIHPDEETVLPWGPKWKDM